MDGLIANAACKTVGVQIPSGGRKLGCLPHHTTRPLPETIESSDGFRTTASSDGFRTMENGIFGALSALSCGALSVAGFVFFPDWLAGIPVH